MGFFVQLILAFLAGEPSGVQTVAMSPIHARSIRLAPEMVELGTEGQERHVATPEPGQERLVAEEPFRQPVKVVDDDAVHVAGVRVSQ